MDQQIITGIGAYALSLGLGFGIKEYLGRRSSVAGRRFVSNSKLDKYKIVLGDSILCIKGGEWSPLSYQRICDKIREYIASDQAGGTSKRYKAIRIIGGPRIEVRESQLSVFREHREDMGLLNPVLKLKQDFPSRVTLYVVATKESSHFAFGYPSLVTGTQRPVDHGVEIKFAQRDKKTYRDLEKHFSRLERELGSSSRVCDCDCLDPDDVVKMVEGFDSCERSYLFDRYFDSDIGRFRSDRQFYQRADERLNAIELHGLTKGVDVSLRRLARELSLGGAEDVTSEDLVDILQVYNKAAGDRRIRRSEFVALNDESLQ